MTEAAPKGRYLTILPLDAEVATAVARAWWPISRLGEGLEELARRAGLGRSTETSLERRRPDDEAPGEWIAWAAGHLGLEAEPVDAPVPEVAAMLRAAGPALVLLAQGREAGFVLLLGSRSGRLRLLGADLAEHRLPVEHLRASLCWRFEAPAAPEIAPVLEAARIPAARRRRVQAAMLRERLGAERIGGVWMLREPAAAPILRQVARAGIPRLLGAVLGVFAVLYAGELLGWSLIGRSVLDGRLDFGWLTAWLLLILSIVPLRFVGGWLEARIALDVGRMLKARLLAGALRMDEDRVTRQGVGHLIGRVMESQALEGLALNGGMGVLVALLELAIAAWVLSVGAAGPLHLVLLGGFALGMAVLSRRYHVRLKAWTLSRLDMTNRLIESMVGHRTRLAQERPEKRDAAEDRDLQAYLAVSGPLDRAAVVAMSGLPSAWLLAGLAGLAPAFARADAPSATALAISLGGVLLAQRAFGSIVGGVAGLSRATIAWGQVSEIAGEDGEPEPSADFAFDRPAGGRTPLIAARGLSYAYDPNAAPVFENLDLTIAAGDRLLLEGASGGGKSTLTALLCGLRAPTRGSLLLSGLDRHTLGPAWRARATAAPQFHENHILSGTLAFNLLMARGWPAAEADLLEAETICRELGLGDVLDRMPAGLHQPVGETGWQLSHGERSRVFLARALLQDADLTILDESFAALDPETLKTCLETSARRARALMVVAHP